MKNILDEYGWPGRSLVGHKGADAAFLLVQHADLAVQKRALPLLKEAYRNGEAAGNQVALLTDRVRAREGKKQLYGTQTDVVDSTIVFAPIKNPAMLDERRARMGLAPIDQYAKRLEKMYGMNVEEL